MSAKDRFKALAETMVANSQSTYGSAEGMGARRMFGSTSIKTGGKMFAFLHKEEHLVVKLPEQRVNELVAADHGERYDPGDGRLQREWLAVKSDAQQDWVALATEAERYVGKMSPKAAT